MLLIKNIITIINRDLSIKRNLTNFASAMSEGLEAYEKREAERKQKKLHKSRYNGRLKKRQWEEESRTPEEIAEKRANFDPADRVKRRKSIILMGYSGINYYGMQRNPGQKTIEEDLFVAMLKNNWINEDAFKQAQFVQFQRAARTDKGVSAARQVCSIKLPETLDVAALNSDLPEQIRVFSVRRVTKGFNCKEQCDARTYTYTLPTVAFANHTEQTDILTYRTTKDTINRLNDLLSMYEGTKNFHNFTCRKEYLDPSSKRYIVSFSCSEPFVTDEHVEFATIKIKGQSFMMHQIRKMVGLTLAVLRNHTVQETITRAFTSERIDIPMAPGLGLVLDQVHYDRYNRRYGEDGLHEPLIWDKEENEIEKFVHKYIYLPIIQTEIEENSMITWLDTLGLHSYDVRANETSKDDTEKNDELKTKHGDSDE